MTVVVSTNMGGYDSVKWAPPGLRSVMFVDREDLAVEADAKGWDVRMVEHNLPRRMAAKMVKLQPLRWLPDDPVQIWLDASYQGTALLEDLPGFYGPWAFFKHHERDCVRAEGEVMARKGRWSQRSVIEQAREYVGQMGRRYGLWFSGLHVRDMRHPKLPDLFRTWHHEVQEWSSNDQVSLAYACWKHDMRPVDILGTPQRNVYAYLYPHLLDGD